MIRFSCPTCHVVLAVPDDQAGRKGPGPKCGQRLLVPPTALNKTVLGKPLVIPPAEKGAGDAFSFNEPAPPQAPPQAQLIPPAGAPIPVATAGWAPAPRPRPSGFWRFLSPSFLVFAMILFPLPWVDIRCSPNGGLAGGKSIVTQSGLEAAYGGYTQNPEMAAAAASEPANDSNLSGTIYGATIYPSPLMCLYPVAALLGIGFALAVRAPAARRVLVGLCALGAFGLLAAQSVGGFPIVGSLLRGIKQVADKEAASGNGKDAIRVAPLIAAGFDIAYTPWLWLSFVADLAAVAAVGAEWAARRGESDPESDPKASRAVRRSFALCATAAAAAVCLALMAWAVFLVVALSRPPGVAGPGLSPRGDRGAPLTEDQRVAWEKLRRKYNDLKCSVYVLGFIIPDHAWRQRIVPEGSGFPKWADSLWFPYGGEGAASLAAQPNVRATAIVDLFGGTDPKVLKWFHDDGTGGKELQSAPTPELDASLKAYLHDLQTRADQLSAADVAPSANQAKAMFDNWFAHPFGTAGQPDEAAGQAPIPPVGGPNIPAAGGR